MTITADGYVSWAERDDRTPKDKSYPYNRNKRYMVVHSMEGWLAPNQTVPSRFLSTEKNADGNYVPAAQASVTFCLLRDGRLIQCFPLEASPWTSGSRGANMDGVPIETEGVAGTPLNEAQVATFVRLVRELEPWFGFTLSHAGKTILEHNELSATACPSGRYAPAYAVLAADTIDQEDDMADVKELNEVMTKREQLRRIASATSEEDGKAYADFLKLHEYAKAQGMIR